MNVIHLRVVEHLYPANSSRVRTGVGGTGVWTDPGGPTAGNNGVTYEQQGFA